MIRLAKTAAALCCVALTSCTSLDKKDADLSIYRTTNDQPGHELVRTEQFLAPVGKPIVIPALQFEPGAFELTPSQRLVVQQIFNSIEEITENTVNDPNSARVAKFKKMQFEIRSYGDSKHSEADAQLASERANAVRDFLTYLGTPSWRLKTRVANNPSEKPRQIEFVRIR
jgi:outer membrane protein OmpA-like peptidoglycan-associated protein